MGYCRFQNTVQDLNDCYDHMDDDALSDEEKRARRRLIRMAIRIADCYGDEVEE